MENEIIDNIDFQQESVAEMERELNMKKIVLKRLELTNFKGTSQRVEVFENGINDIFGANGTGKTTLFDAFTWLLFGKDSHGQSESKANIKTLDSNNKPIMHMDNVVEGTFEVDGKEIVLRRTYKEKWRKPSGAEEKVYDGQTTEYSWDGNDRVGKGEYEKRVAEIIDEKLFKLITDPNYFASLKMDERREIILKMAGEVTPEEVKFSCPELLNFNTDKSVPEQRKVAMSSKLKLTKDRDNYPARIDEQKRLINSKKEELLSMELPEKNSIHDEIREQKIKLIELDKKQSDINSMVESIMKKNNDRLEKLREIEQYKHFKQKESDTKVDEFNQVASLRDKEVMKLRDEVTTLKTRITNGKALVTNKQNELKDIAKKIEELKTQEKPNFETETICPTCNRELDADVVESEKEKLVENWMMAVKKKITSYKNEGDVINSDVVRFKESVFTLETELKEAEDKLNALVSNETLVYKGYQVIDFSKDKEYLQLVKFIPEEVSITEEIEQMKEAVELDKQVINKCLEDLNAKLSLFTKSDILQSDIDSSATRIEQLLEEEKEVNIGIANQEKIIYLCDLWTKTTVELLNRRVANKFDFVKFKMFNYTQEGNALPTCEIIVDGVDYVSLNTASRVNAGLDIINALIKHYEVKAPIFIDGRESVTTINAPDTQIINLIVKEEN